MGACPDAGADVDAYLREATGARTDASAARHAEGHDPSHFIHANVDAVAFHLDIAGIAAGEGTALGFGLAAGGMLGGIAAMWGGYAMSVEEGDRRNIEYDSEMMRGCLAAFEGRADEPEVRAYMAESEAFANGVRDAERVAVRDPALFACIRAAVVSANDAGANAVYGGEDLSPECAERYERDLAFQHGVDAARAQRDADPVAYEAARREASTLHTSVMDGRSGPVRG
jgi:hypothetical protein